MLGSAGAHPSTGTSARARPAVRHRWGGGQLTAAVGGGSFLVLWAGSWVPAWSGDEAATVMVVRRPLDQVLLTFDHDPALLPYYLLVWGWSTPSAGHGWLRLLSVLATASAVAATHVLARRVGGERLGLLSAAVMIILPAVSRYGHEVRPYAGTLLLVVVAVLCWWDGLATRGRRLGLAAAVLGLGLLHPYALLIVPVLVLTSWLTPSGTRVEGLRTALTCAVGLLPLTPFLLVVSRGAVGQVDPAPVSVPNLAAEVLRLPVAMLSPPLAPLASVAVWLLVATGLVGGWWRRRVPTRPLLLLVGWLTVPPLTLCTIQLAGVGPGLVARYWTLCLPAVAIAAALALDALWRRRAALGAVALLLLAGLALPAHGVFRTPDGHLGQRWRDIGAVLALTELDQAPLLVLGWTYRAVVSNDPGLVDRMPLVRDPAPTGHVNPRLHRASSPVFAELVASHGVVVVLQDETGYSDALPTRRSFPGFRAELEAYPVLAVRCAWFGEPLGVFAASSASLSPARSGQLAHDIAAIAPAHVRCAAG